jgi:hypothetical protein
MSSAECRGWAVNFPLFLVPGEFGKFGKFGKFTVDHLRGLVSAAMLRALGLYCRCYA